MNNILLELLNAAQIIVIMGWFWLIMFTIFRAENFKKRYFTVLMLIYLLQGIAEVTRMLKAEYVKDTITVMSISSNALSIFGFAFLTIRYIKFKEFYYEKINSINDAIVNGVVRGSESPKV